jgi:hypothetical protein
MSKRATKIVKEATVSMVAAESNLVYKFFKTYKELIPKIMATQESKNNRPIR